MNWTTKINAKDIELLSNSFGEPGSISFGIKDRSVYDLIDKTERGILSAFYYFVHQIDYEHESNPSIINVKATRNTSDYIKDGFYTLKCLGVQGHLYDGTYIEWEFVKNGASR